MSDPTRERLNAAKRRIAEALLGAHGVHGVGLSLKDGAVVLYHDGGDEKTLRARAVELAPEVKIAFKRADKPGI